MSLLLVKFTETLFRRFTSRIREQNGDVAIEYFVIAAVIIVGVIAALYALRDQLILLIESITEILTPVEPTVTP